MSKVAAAFEPVTIECEVVNDNVSGRQAIDVEAIVADIAMLGPRATYFEKSIYLTQVRNIKAGTCALVPVLWRRHDGSTFALMRFLPF